MKTLYPTITDLKKAIKNYLQKEDEPTPRHFRSIGIGISIQVLEYWKVHKQDYYLLIKRTEDLILAKMEQKFSYGGKATRNIYYILRAYDKEKYIPELTMGNENIHSKPINVVLPSQTINKKGLQSERRLTKNNK